jgi:hypothetical protein
MRFFIVFLFVCSVKISYAGNPDYWSGRPISKESGRATNVYTAAMHESSSVRGEFKENGRFYFSGEFNSFGFPEVLNPEQQVIFCNPGDRTFSDAIRGASATRTLHPYQRIESPSYAPGKQTWVKETATTVGFRPSTLDAEIVSVFEGSATPVLPPNTYGRFCYDPDSTDVNYENPATRTNTYCDSSTASPFTFVDPVSSFQCQLSLDVNLKLGQTRFVRQLESGTSSTPTVSQGFISCRQNNAGFAVLELEGNPESCGPTNRESCVRSCDWAENVVCDPREMPRWGAGRCGAYGTMLFKDDVLEVNSSAQLSYDEASGKLYKGSALMACVAVESVGGLIANWSILESSCEVDE